MKTVSTSTEKTPCVILNEAIDLNDIRQILRLAWDDAVVYNKCFAKLWHPNQ